MRSAIPGLVVVLLAFACVRPAAAERVAIDVERVVSTLVATHGVEHEARIRRGVGQVAERWWPADGTDEEMAAFCERGFIADEPGLARTFTRLELVLEQMDGHLHEVTRELRRPQDLDTGEVIELDRLLASVELGAHVTDDLFRSKVAFLALLNFPVHTLAERLELGPGWDRETWARSRLLDRFASRVPAEVAQGITEAITAAEAYVSGYNIRMDRLLDADGARVFPEGLRLISHWGLRDELKAQYAEPDGLARQRLIQRVMERIVRQEVPAAVIDNGGFEWCPLSNQVRALGGDTVAVEREPDTRYRHILEVFRAERHADPFCPATPTYMARRFEGELQVPEAELESLLLAILTSADLREEARVVERRLGRPLEPFDIWYPGFSARGRLSQERLDQAVGTRYPNVAAFQADLPAILGQLGFAPDTASWLAERIVVDPARGSGHAMGAVRRGDAAHLRTRFGPAGMDAKGFNIALHELGHNVEQVLSLDRVDHWALSGVPGPAFTEAVAYVFQARDLEVLGVAPGSGQGDREEALGTLWNAFEIAGVSLVDMRMWRWLYAHPEATPAELREATLAIAREVWNAHFAPLLGSRDCELLAIYSHMLDYPLYLPNYAVAHPIAHQVAAKLAAGDFGAEVERMMRLGRLTPDAWMRAAVGRPLSADAILAEARAALDGLEE